MLHELYDVSILFDAREQARLAWTQIAATHGPEGNLSDGAMHALGWLRDEVMAREMLDTRLVEPSFTTGAAFIAIKLGVMDQVAIRKMLTDPETGESAYPDPWGETALQRVAGKLVVALLDHGGKAVVLHKAGGVVKSAAQFRSELGDARDLERRPFLAWLDMMACDDGKGGVICRSFGMVHYFGAPNVRAGMPRTDSQAIECSMQAVHYTCAQIAGYNESPFGFDVVAVPEFRVAGTPYPAIEWDAAVGDDGLFIDLTCPTESNAP